MMVENCFYILTFEDSLVSFCDELVGKFILLDSGFSRSSFFEVDLS